jgi:threonine dehydrogenase-like Zn-dependent dehydrogenase
LLTAHFYSPAEIIVIDLDDYRLQTAKRFGATATISGSDGQASETVLKMTGGRGVDTAIEAVGVPASFITCGAGCHPARADDLLGFAPILQRARRMPSCATRN